MGKESILKKISIAKKNGGTWRDRERDRVARYEAVRAEWARDPFGRSEREKEEKEARERELKIAKQTARRLKEQASLQKKLARKEQKRKNLHTLQYEEEGVVMEYLLLTLYYWLTSFIDSDNPLRQGKLPPDPYRGE